MVQLLDVKKMMIMIVTRIGSKLFKKLMQSSDLLCFWKLEDANGWLSNWSPHKIIGDSMEFSTLEHYLMYHKAKLMGDNVVADRILVAPNSKLAKSLGREVSNWNEELWVSKRESIMIEGITLKVASHHNLRSMLLNTGSCIIVECSPYDKVWSCGMIESECRTRPHLQWSGRSLLGKCWMEVRRRLRVAEESRDLGTSDIAYRTNGCYSGCNIMGVAKVQSYRLSKINMANVRKRLVPTFQDYSNYCTIPGHIQCMGHLCINKKGNLMYPGSICTVVGNIKDKIAELSESLIGGSIHYSEYVKGLDQLMLSKEGVLRGRCLSGFVGGSMRMVILPSWDLNINEIYIPRYAIKSLKIPSRNYDGIDGPKFKYDTVKEGSYVIVVRPPSLNESSVQPMKLKFWDKTAIGISPLNCAEYHADFDGDEMQLYFINTVEAVRECEKWGLITRPMFDFDAIKEELGDSFDRKTFMDNTTINLNEALANVNITPTMKASKIKNESFEMIRTQLACTDLEFVVLSENGIHDIMQQQLTQGEIGKISRSARGGTMDFLSYGSYERHISKSVGCSYSTPDNRLVVCRSIPLFGAYAGSPACTLVSRICSVVQQSYLDSHRAKLHKISKFDMASSFITGEVKDGIIALSSTAQTDGARWSAKISESEDLYICEFASLSKINFSCILGSYNVGVLSNIPHNRRLDVARKGVKFLVMYYDLPHDDVEVNTLAYVINNRCGDYSLPPTESNGVGSRNYRWLTKLVVQNWTKIYTMDKPDETGVIELDRRYNVDTRVEACVFANFDNLTSVDTNVKPGSIKY